MESTQNNTESPKKVCRECGCEIVEQVESPLYECERCIRSHDE